MLRRMVYWLYMRSGAWDKKRKAALKRARYRCEICNDRNMVLEVHHKHYKNFMHERPADLIVLCRKCHAKADEKRRWDARLNGWATKVYGKAWRKTPGYYVADGAFRGWLKSKQLK